MPFLRVIRIFNHTKTLEQGESGQNFEAHSLLSKAKGNVKAIRLLLA